MPDGHVVERERDVVETEGISTRLVIVTQGFFQTVCRVLHLHREPLGERRNQIHYQRPQRPGWPMAQGGLRSRDLNKSRRRVSVSDVVALVRWCDGTERARDHSPHSHSLYFITLPQTTPCTGTRTHHVLPWSPQGRLFSPNTSVSHTRCTAPCPSQAAASAGVVQTAPLIQHTYCTRDGRLTQLFHRGFLFTFVCYLSSTQ